jgi:nucleoside-diphosphate-sugar epimerase
LITGSTGFVGSHVLKRLLTEGHDVTAIVRSQSDRTRIKNVQNDIDILEFDLRNLDDSAPEITGRHFDVCLHLAWYAEPGMYLHSHENVASLSSTLNLASLLARSGCQRFVGTGTCFEYDPDSGFLSESSPLKPDSLYAACKTAASVGLEKLSNDSDMQTAWVRLFYQYGPFEDQRRLVPAIISSMINGQKTKTTEGAQIRDFLHIEDVASAICAVGASAIAGSVNIGSSRPITVREIVHTIGKITGQEDLIEFGALPYRESDPMFVCANNQRLLEHTDWQQQYDLDSGLRHTVAWWERARK